MSNRMVKCRWCGLKDTSKDEMVSERITPDKNRFKYFHPDCYDDYLKDKEFKKKESQEWDSLNETIRDIYGVTELPNNVYPMLQNLRNGKKVFGNNQKTSVRYKEGYSYPIIEETFKRYRDDIEYANETKDFNGLDNAIRYALAIVIDKIYVVSKDIETKNNYKKEVELKSGINRLTDDVEVDLTEEGYKPSFKKKKKKDLSDYLND